MRTLIICSIVGGLLGRGIYRFGSEVARWSDADQLDFIFLPLLSAIIPYAAAVTLTLVIVGNGWLRHDEPK